jgi:protein involved in plasmid replication-relaxation
VRRPAGLPVALSQEPESGCMGAASAQFSPPNDSASHRPNYVTADRLFRITAEMSELDWTLLSFTSAVRLASGKQLARRFWNAPREGDSAEARSARRALARLARWRVLEPLPRRIGGRRAGSGAIVFRVGVAGVKLLAQRGLQPRRLDAPGSSYVAHTLACTELVVELHEANRAGDLECIEVQSEPTCWRGFLGPGAARLVLKPDLFARIGAGRASEDRWFIEVDLATEASGTILTKARRYIAHYRSGSEQAEHGVYPRVLWAAPDARRAEQIEDALRRLPAEGARLFTVCLLAEAVACLAVEAGS